LKRECINFILSFKPREHKRGLYGPLCCCIMEYEEVVSAWVMFMFKSLKRPQWRCRTSCLVWSYLQHSTKCTAAYKLNVMLSPPHQTCRPLPGNFSFYCTYTLLMSNVKQGFSYSLFFKRKQAVCNKGTFSKIPLKFLPQGFCPLVFILLR